MNFVFIIDTSLSMAQTFDSISYLDIAKSNIKKFVCDREYNNYQLKRTKYDKYFLLTFSDIIDENYFFKSWSSITEQFLLQLSALKITYNNVNLETVIQNSYKLLNYIKKIGPDKHVYGRLFSKVQNSVIILITDGGYITNNENFNLSSITLKDNNQYLVNDKNNKIINIYKDLYCWDQRFFAIVLTNKREEFDSFLVLDKICKYTGSKITPIDNANFLTEKLMDLNKALNNTGALINFNFNKQKKKNYVTFLEYNGKIEDLNEKWLFPDELIISNENKILPPKNGIPIYEFGNIKYNFKLPPEYFDKYEIKDKLFIFNTLIDGDCWNGLTINDFLREYKTSITIDVLISDIKNKKVLKKPFAVINFIFSKEILDQMSSSLSNRGNMNFNKFFNDYYCNHFNNIFKVGQKNVNDFNYIKCEFLNLPYHYSELLSLIHNKKLDEVLFKIDIDKYFESIPFYYIKKIIKFLEKNKIKQFSDKDKENYKRSVYANFSQEIINQIDILSRIENENIIKIHKKLEDNKNLMMQRRAKFNLRDLYYDINNRQFMINRVNEKEEDQQYLEFIDRAFQIDNISSDNKNNNLNININGFEDKMAFNSNYLTNPLENEHELDIELMGANREQLFRNDHLKSCLIPEIELRYLKQAFLFGNQFIPRNNAYSKQGTSSFNNNSLIQNDTIFNYINDEDNIIYKTNINNNINTNNINNETLSKLKKNINKVITTLKEEKQQKEKNNKNIMINNKRNREENNKNAQLEQKINDSINTDISSSSEPPEPTIFNDNNSESDGSNDLMLDELPDNKLTISKMANNLIEEFKNSLNDEPIKDGIKFNVKYDISTEKLNKWKFNKKITKFSQELMNNIYDGGNDIINIINKIIDENYFAPDKKTTYNFIEKVLVICQNCGVNQMVQTKVKNLLKRYS